MKIWELREISEEEVGRRVRVLRDRIIELLQDPANLGQVRQFCRLVSEMGVYCDRYIDIMVRETARGQMPEYWARLAAEEAKEKAQEARRQTRKRKAA
jgi:hypothetical protein